MQRSSIDAELYWRRTGTKIFNFRSRICKYRLRPSSDQTDLRIHPNLKCRFFIMIQQIVSFELIFESENPLHH